MGDISPTSTDMGSAATAALIAAKQGEVTDELQEILDDRVPLVFGTALVLSVPLMAWLAIFKPF